MQWGKGREGIVSWMKGKGTGGIGRLGKGTGHSDSKEKGKVEEKKTDSSSSSITTTKVQTHEKRGEETRDSKRARPEAR